MRTGVAVQDSKTALFHFSTRLVYSPTRPHNLIMTSARFTVDSSVELCKLDMPESGKWQTACPCGGPIKIEGFDVVAGRTVWPCRDCSWSVFLQYGDLDVAISLFYAKRYLEAVEMYAMSRDSGEHEDGEGDGQVDYDYNIWEALDAMIKEKRIGPADGIAMYDDFCPGGQHGEELSKVAKEVYGDEPEDVADDGSDDGSDSNGAGAGTGAAGAADRAGATDTDAGESSAAGNLLEAAATAAGLGLAEASKMANDFWLYLDPTGATQGPFSTEDMHDWFLEGHFTEDLKVRRAGDDTFEALSTFPALVGGGGGGGGGGEAAEAKEAASSSSSSSSPASASANDPEIASRVAAMKLATAAAAGGGDSSSSSPPAKAPVPSKARAARAAQRAAAQDALVLQGMKCPKGVDAAVWRKVRALRKLLRQISDLEGKKANLNEDQKRKLKRKGEIEAELTGLEKKHKGLRS